MNAVRAMAWQLVVLLAVLLVVIVGGFVALAVTGNDTGQFVLFVGGPLVTTIVGAVLASNQVKIRSDTQAIQKATNGLMSQQFSGLATKLDDAEVQRASNEAGRLADQQPVDLLTPRPPTVPDQNGKSTP